MEHPHQSVVAVLSDTERAEVDELTARLDQLPDGGVGARNTARAQLVADHQPRNRLTITRRTVHLIDQHQDLAS